VLLYSSICLSAYIFAFDLSPWLHAIFDCLRGVDGCDAPALLGDSLCDHIAPGDGDRGAQLGSSTEEYPARPCRIVIAGLIGLSLVFLERRPRLSGIFLGLLSCKPQYGVLVPLAFLVSRNWRAFASATATSIVLGVVAGIAFGFRGWPAFIEALFDRNAGLSPDSRVELALQSVYRLVHWLGRTVRVSWTVTLGRCRRSCPGRMRNLGQAASLFVESGSLMYRGGHVHPLRARVGPLHPIGCGGLLISP
jgi:Glycosyltransferase family 87